MGGVVVVFILTVATECDYGMHEKDLVVEMDGMTVEQPKQSLSFIVLRGTGRRRESKGEGEKVKWDVGCGMGGWG